MNQALDSTTLSLKPADNARLLELCGEHHKNIKLIESELHITCNQHGSDFVLEGKAQDLENATRILERMYAVTEIAGALDEPRIYQIMNNINNDNGNKQDDQNFAKIITPLRHVAAKTVTQSEYVDKIEQNDIVFGVGPAGTGKTYLAVASAVKAFISEDVSRIVLVRPAVEAGEQLGFLPGDIGQKVDPYLRPLYDALYELLGFEKVAQMVEKGVIELAPLAYMRGRTLADAFVILDEAQNTTVPQMKMFLTRIGFGSQVVITGDLSQIDLPRGTYCGLRHALDILSSVKGIEVTHFSGKDIVRHPLVQRIVEAYERHETGKDG